MFLATFMLKIIQDFFLLLQHNWVFFSKLKSAYIIFWYIIYFVLSLYLFVYIYFDVSIFCSKQRVFFKAYHEIHDYNKLQCSSPNHCFKWQRMITKSKSIFKTLEPKNKTIFVYLPSSAQLNSSSTQLCWAEICFIVVFSSHPPTRPASNPPTRESIIRPQ